MSRNDSRPWQQPDRVQGWWFDGGMLLANFLILGSLNQVPFTELSDWRIGVFLSLGILTQLLGAWLKKAPLQQRIETLKGDAKKTRDHVLGCLTFIYFIFFLLVTSMALALVGFVNLNESGGVRETLWLLTSFLVAGIVSGLVWYSISHPEQNGEANIRWRYQEIAANVFLWISATILTRYFWTALLLESEPLTYMGFSLRAFVFIAATSALFMVFYVPARLLFLAEDYKYPMTWVRLWLVAMFPLLTAVFVQAG